MVIALLSLAGICCAIILDSWLVIGWTLACCILAWMDVAVMERFYKNQSPTSAQLLRAELSVMAIGFCAVSVFLMLPLALMTAGRFDFAVIAMALFATSATRTASMFSVSIRVGIACYLPYFVSIFGTLGVDVYHHPHIDIVGHVIAVVALISCLGYTWLEWSQRNAAECALDAMLAVAEAQRDLASRDATVSRMLFQHTSLRAALLDADNRFIAVNAAWLNAVGKTEADLLGLTMSEAMPLAKAGWTDALAAAKLGESTFVDGDSTLRFDGKRVVLNWQVQPWYNDDGTYGGAVGYAQDVTEIHAARAAEKAKQERLDLALKASKGFIWEVDYIAKTVTYDQAAIDFYGHEPTFEMVSKRDHSATHPDDREISKLQAKRLGATGGYGRMEARHINDDGSIRWVRSDVAPLNITNGKPTSFVMFTSDITEEMKRHERLAEMMVRANIALSEKRKILEEICGEALASDQSLSKTEVKAVQSPTSCEPLGASDSIESTFTQLFASFDQILTEIDERDTALAAAVQQLRAARTSAEAANVAKSQFLANMSHELRTPLNAIIGYTEILIEDAEYECRDDAAKDAHKVRISATHLLRLINEILDLSKIEAGKMDITREPTSLTDLLVDIVNSSEPLAAAHQNRLVVEIDSERTLAFTDGFRLRQCLLNLVSNACKFTDKGLITIRLTHKETDENHRWFDISVQDSGIGMADTHIDNLFRPFSQADGSTTRKYGGTGLGLALTREMTHLLDGEVFVTSEVGVGSTFTLRIPAIGLEVGDVGLIRGADTASALVLVIDDDASARTLTARSATALGMSVACAETGRAALAFCDENDVGLIILDLQLPDMDGYDVLAALRGAEKTRHTPVMIVSVDDDRRRSISLGAQEHLAKPCPSAVLTAAMARLARRQDANTKRIGVATAPPTKNEADSDTKFGTKTQRSA